MHAPKHDLAQIQLWMQSVIMSPGGVVPGILADEAQTHLAMTPADIERVIAPSQRQTSIERLEIYAHAYFARLLECLRAEFPMTVKAVGEDLFDQFAVGYLEQYPSRSYTLDHLGERFSRFLAETRPVDDETDVSWLDFLIDLARLEWNIAEVFDGPGVENATLLDQHQILAIPPDRWAEVRLVPVPCLRVIRLDFPVHDYYQALRKEQEAIPPGRAVTHLAITRRNYVVRHIPLQPLEAEILALMLEGAAIGEAIARANMPDDADLVDFANQLQVWFHTWAAEGFFLRAELDD